MTSGNSNQRETWVENVKVIACLLVVIGHFWQGVVAAGIVSESIVYNIFVRSIYSFHVQLFFICSGYLYQKNSVVNTIASWKKNTYNKLISLGIPYVFFSVVTWGLKVAFADGVNRPPKGLIETLLMTPESPYWYLYTLFFVFFITPTFSKKAIAKTVLIISFLLKLLLMFRGGVSIYVVASAISYEFWFVCGMCLSIMDFGSIFDKIHSMWIGIILWCIFLIVAINGFKQGIHTSFFVFAVGMIACLAIIMIVYPLSKNGKKLLINITEYIYPIFLMHTIIASGVRIVLQKIGIEGAVLHTVLGLSASIIGPIITTEIIKKSKWMEFFLYPKKYIRM